MNELDEQNKYVIVTLYSIYVAIRNMSGVAIPRPDLLGHDWVRSLRAWAHLGRGWPCSRVDPSNGQHI